MPLNNPTKMSHPHPTIPCPISVAEEALGKTVALNTPKSHWTLCAFGGTLEGPSEPMARNRGQVADGGRGPLMPPTVTRQGRRKSIFAPPIFKVFLPKHPFTAMWKKPSDISSALLGNDALVGRTRCKNPRLSSLQMRNRFHDLFFCNGPERPSGFQERIRG
jgi:hypothetical protein